MIVVDTNVIAYLHIPGQWTADARAALVRDAAWAAPLLWRSELRNILATYVRRDELPLPEAILVQHAAEELMAGREFTVSSSDVLQISAEAKSSAYDAEFVALARRLAVPLVTADRRLTTRFAGWAVSLREFAGGTAS
ncbi:MAG TPA: type II toxin-antitoxin system VapC family toxin [Gemmatimonadaceae bacterium]|nr:type II toxin-antitoxin system VapC family toxin [Gemmatimonadaceae bacterium]